MINRTAVFLLIAALSVAAAAGSTGNVIRISNISIFKKLSRSAVDFPHERHYSWGPGCLDCHHSYKGGVNVLDVNELKPGSPAVSCASCHTTARELERSYHRMCRSCHIEMKKRGTSHGPVMCGQCHSKKEN